MKLNQLLLTGATCLVSIISVSGNADRVLASPSKTEANTVVAQMKQSVAIMSGTFVAAEKPTTGMARIVTENGHPT